MMTKEEYEKEIVRMWDSLRTTNKGKSSCDGVLCGDCQLSLFDGCSSAEDIFDIYKTVEKWSNEHPPKKYKVSRLEYDILDMFIKNNSEIDYVFNNFGDAYIPKLLEKGYFKGANGNMSIRYYYNNCEVVD